MLELTKIGHFSGHNDSIYSLCKGSEAGGFVSAAGDGMVVRWHKDNPNGTLICKLQDSVYSQLVLDSLLLIGTRRGNLHLADLENKKEIRNLRAHKGGIFSIAEINKKLVATAGEDGCIVIFDRNDFSVVKSLKFSEKSCRKILVVPERKLLIAGYSDNYIRFISLNDFTVVHEFEAHDNSVFALALSPLHNHLFSGGRDAVLKVWDLTGKAVDSVNAHLLHINDISFSPNKLLLATASMDKSIRIWDAHDLALLKVINFEKYQAHRSSVNNVVWLSDTELLSSSDDRSIQLFRIASVVEP